MTLRVFTDLDGTLLEHESYSLQPALGALNRLRELEMALYFNTSKTSAEIRLLQSRLGFHCAYVCENGGALYQCDEEGQNWQKQAFGPPQEQWLAPLHELRESHQLKFAGFSDWTPRELSELTGLSVTEAEAAREREYSEPIQWRGSASDRAVLERFLQDNQLQLIEGGRFFSVQGHFDKQTPMQWLREQARDGGKQAPVTTVALGDSPNDEAMLEAASVAVIIKSGKSQRIKLTRPAKVIHTSRPGPAGWSEAMGAILELHEQGKLPVDAD